MHYTKNPIIESPLNLNWYELHELADKDFELWIQDMKDEVIRIWDEQGIPPTNGKTTEQMKSDFRKMKDFNVIKFEKRDNDGGLCIVNPGRLGSVVNQFFPTMMKTKINYTEKGDGKSIYDYLASQPGSSESKRVLSTGRRNYQRDSFYDFSRCVKKKDRDCPSGIFAITGEQWIKLWNEKPNEGYDYWLHPIKEKKYTGWAGESEDMTIDGEMIEEKKVDLDNLLEYNGNYIRIYKKENKLFPGIFKHFKNSWCQMAVNFPCLTAKWVTEKYLEPGKKSILFDQSSGWGGRIAGSMLSNRNIHYVGTDPNPDHWVDSLKKTKYEILADFINDEITSFFDEPNTYDIFRVGSEVIQYEDRFQQYKGKVDLAFTSPPYFIREGYSEDENQSGKKFPKYNDWRDNFLSPTLKTTVEWLKPGGYILWNIANPNFKNEYDLEGDSCRILKNLGMKQEPTIKMVLGSMPGGNRMGEDGKPKTKNFTKIGNKFVKFEPIFVFKKGK